MTRWREEGREDLLDPQVSPICTDWAIVLILPV